MASRFCCPLHPFQTRSWSVPPDRISLRKMREHDVLLIKLHPKHRARQNGDDGAFGHDLGFGGHDEKFES
jgi:hypothetical protein